MRGNERLRRISDQKCDNNDFPCLFPCHGTRFHYDICFESPYLFQLLLVIVATVFQIPGVIEMFKKH